MYAQIVAGLRRFVTVIVRMYASRGSERFVKFACVAEQLQKNQATQPRRGMSIAPEFLTVIGSVRGSIADITERLRKGET